VRLLSIGPTETMPNGRNPTPLTAAAGLRRRDLLGGLIHEYKAA